MVKQEYEVISDDEDGTIIKSSPSRSRTPALSPTTGLSPPSTPKKEKKKRSSSQSTTTTVKTPKTPRSPKSPKSPKSKWSKEEDESLIRIMEKVLKAHLWSEVKGPDGDARLVSRTSYGVGYHALMLLRQGTGKSAPAPGQPK